MIPIDKIEAMFRSHNGIMRTHELLDGKVYYKDIQILIRQGIIEKVRYGYYQWVDGEPVSEAVTITRLFPDAILCLDTALYYYQYSDRTPLRWHLAVNKDSGKSRFRLSDLNVKPYFYEPSILDLGVTDGMIDGNPVRIYDRDRTICDCLRYMGKMDREMFTGAIRSYVNDPKKRVDHLLDYAVAMRVREKVETYIGVWM